MKKNKNLKGFLISLIFLLPIFLPNIVSDKVALRNYQCFILGNYFSLALMLIYFSVKKLKTNK
jgi:ABC-type transport system involved in cytochrome c biogenesis permease component